MPKVNIKQALAEKDDHDAITCRTCAAPAEEGYEPHCVSCALYWRDCDTGLWDDLQLVEETR